MVKLTRSEITDKIVEIYRDAFDLEITADDISIENAYVDNETNENVYEFSVKNVPAEYSGGTIIFDENGNYIDCEVYEPAHK